MGKDRATSPQPLSRRLMLAAVALVVAVAAGVHGLWQHTARGNVADLVGELNREILQGVAGTVRSLSEDVAASQRLLHSQFVQGSLSPARPAEVERYFLNLLAAKPLYTWVQIGFANGDFWGANREADEGLRFVRRHWLAQERAARREVTAYTLRDNQLWAGAKETTWEAYFAPDRPWYRAALEKAGAVAWTEVYLFATSRTPGLDAAAALPGPDGRPMVVGIGFELKHLSHYLGRLPVAAKGRVFLMNSRQQVVASSDASYAARAATPQDDLRLPTLADLPDPLLHLVRDALDQAGPASPDAQGFRQLGWKNARGEGYFITLQQTGYADWVLGTVIPEHVFLERITASRQLLIGLLLAFAVLAGMVAALFSRRWIGQPVDQLTDAAQAIEQGHLDTRVHLANSAEFAGLGKAFNYMARSLKERERERDIFGRVVSPEVLEKLLTGQLQLGGETCWVSVIFSDIRGFTTLSEQLDPQAVVALLNDYLGEMSAAITPHGGYINNFIGDAIVAVFGAPIAQNDIETRAVAAALAMRERLNALNNRRRERGEPPLESGIGISTGVAVAGQIGSLERLLYTVIGDAVNLAARLEAMTKDVPGNPILLNARTAQALTQRPDLKLRSLGHHDIKGRVQSEEVFALG